MKIIKKSLLKIKGFTLIELLVVTAIIGILGVVSTQVVSSVLRSQNKINIVQEVRQNGDFIINKLERDVREARAIDQVTCTGASCVVDTVVWDCSGSVFLRDGRAVISIASTQVVPGSCVFQVTNPPDPTANQILTLNFSLEQSSPLSGSEFRTRVPFRVTIGTRKN